MAEALPLNDYISQRYGPAKLGRLVRYLLFALLLVLLAGWQAKVNIPELLADLPTGLSKLATFFPPLWSALPGLVQPALVTILLALLPLPIGMVLSLPVALAAARNIAPADLRFLTRAYITFQRNFPEFILVLLLVRAFGLGPYPGIVAIALGTVGMLAKLWADAIEEVDPKILESLEATGASHFQIIRYGVIPEIMPALIAHSIFRFEVNMRQAGLLGAVGAGGLGWELSYSLNLLEYERVTVTFLFLLLLILVAEKVSDFLRRRILEAQLK
ncbi:MAG: phosphonate ABC transporter, permease protein PhnE [Opitutales bacterium]